SHIAARMGEAGHQSEGHRVRASGHDNWDRVRCLSRRKVSRKRRGNDDVGIDAHQLGRQIWQPVKITIGKPKLEADLADLDISYPPHTRSKACPIAFLPMPGSGHQTTGDGPHPLLRARRERRRGRAAKESDELATVVHSITSSARASTLGGMVRPSALAVFRLIVSSNLIGCVTGKSAG